MLQAQAPPLVLASGSPARAALMRVAGLRFAVEPAPIDEGVIKRAMRDAGRTAEETAFALARAKAEAVARDRSDGLVIAADQILVCDGAWFDKPADRSAARSQLGRLSGRPHVLVTAVICRLAGAETWAHAATPRLRMRVLSEAFIEAYLDAEGDAVLGSVGAYRLEGLGIRLFERVDGEHGAIMGLPMLPLLAYLRTCGVLPVD